MWDLGLPSSKGGLTFRGGSPGASVLVYEVRVDHREECQTILKLTRWVRGTNSSTFERKDP